MRPLGELSFLNRKGQNMDTIGWLFHESCFTSIHLFPEVSIRHEQRTVHVFDFYFFLAGDCSWCVQACASEETYPHSSSPVRMGSQQNFGSKSSKS